MCMCAGGVFVLFLHSVGWLFFFLVIFFLANFIQMFFVVRIILWLVFVHSVERVLREPRLWNAGSTYFVMWMFWLCKYTPVSQTQNKLSTWLLRLLFIVEQSAVPTTPFICIFHLCSFACTSHYRSKASNWQQRNKTEHFVSTLRSFLLYKFSTNFNAKRYDEYCTMPKSKFCGNISNDEQRILWWSHWNM